MVMVFTMLIIVQANAPPFPRRFLSFWVYDTNCFNRCSKNCLIKNAPQKIERICVLGCILSCLVEEVHHKKWPNHWAPISHLVQTSYPYSLSLSSLKVFFIDFFLKKLLRIFLSLEWICNTSCSILERAQFANPKVTSAQNCLIEIKSTYKLLRTMHAIRIHDLLLLFQLDTQTFKSVNLGYLFFNFNHPLEFSVKSG
jgi:hypothetical protein